jgi:hypothetical protein
MAVTRGIEYQIMIRPLARAGLHWPASSCYMRLRLSLTVIISTRMLWLRHELPPYKTFALLKLAQTPSRCS